MSISGWNNFTAFVSVQPAFAVVPGGASTFTLSVTPSGIGAFQFPVLIANDDGDENPYDWTVSGTTGPSPTFEMDVNRGPIPIADGGSDAGISIPAGTPLVLTYTVSQIFPMGGGLHHPGTPPGRSPA